MKWSRKTERRWRGVNAGELVGTPILREGHRQLRYAAWERADATETSWVVVGWRRGAGDCELSRGCRGFLSTDVAPPYQSRTSARLEIVGRTGTLVEISPEPMVSVGGVTGARSGTTEAQPKLPSVGCRGCCSKGRAEWRQTQRPVEPWDTRGKSDCSISLSVSSALNVAADQRTPFR
ncbi:hypothetical protein NL676_039675 [Syzygium grande]|nr:hypothetical protein NL676_039675 [Syzygium grande]